MSLRRIGLFVVLGVFAASAQASYAQMRLDGILALLALLMLMATGFLVDVALLVRAFRYRVAVIVACVVAAAVVGLFLYTIAAPGERAMLAKVLYGGAWRVVLAMIFVVLVPLLFAGPIAQHRALREGIEPPRWIAAGMLLQLALLPAFVVLAFTDHHFGERERAAGREQGIKVRPGELAALLPLADERRERIWGTGWTYPWPHATGVASPYLRSDWVSGLGEGIDRSPLIAADEPLGPADAAALHALMEQHFSLMAVVRIRAKREWDALEPGRFAKRLAPAGVREAGTVSDEVLAVLLERLEKSGPARLCPGGAMADADRAVLRALVEAKGPVWDVEKRANVMRPEWQAHLERVERMCRARRVRRRAGRGLRSAPRA